MASLQGRTALVTGGSDGLGLAIADAFAGADADVVLVARSREKLEAAARHVRRHGRSVETLSVDLTDPSALEEALSGVDVPIDVLVNNVGVAHLKPIAEIAADEFDEMVTLNLAVPFRLTQLVLPTLVAGQGVIINMSSYWANKMVAGRPSSAYSATRGAIESLTLALASELGPYGVRVNAIAPGSVQTPTLQRAFLDPMSHEQRASYDRYVTEAYPIGRIGVPGDVAAAAVYLASHEAGWITGVVLPVDGGLTVR